MIFIIEFDRCPQTPLRKNIFDKDLYAGSFLTYICIFRRFFNVFIINSMAKIVSGAIMTGIFGLLATGFIMSCSRQADAGERASQTPDTRRAYIVSVSQNSTDGSGLTRLELIGMINYHYLTPRSMDITTVESLLENRTGAEPVEYDAESLAQRQAVMEDSTVSVVYYGEPVRALIYIYNDTTKINKYIFHPSEQIWVSDNYVYRDSVRYPITPRLSLLIDSLAEDVTLPDFFTTHLPG